MENHISYYLLSKGHMVTQDHTIKNKVEDFSIRTKTYSYAARTDTSGLVKSSIYEEVTQIAHVGLSTNLNLSCSEKC